MRTGKKLAEKVFSAESKPCPGTLLEDHVVEETTTHADADAAFAWAAGQAPP